MISHIITFILGIIVGTIGFTGLAQVADTGVQTIQSTVKEVTK